MNTKLMALLIAMIGTSAFGAAFAGSTMNMTTTNSTTTVNAAGTSTVSVQSLNQSVSAPVANSSTIADPKPCVGGWCYIASADPTGLGVVSNNYYQGAFYDVLSASYFLFV